MELRIATCRPLPEPDHDEELLLEALAGAGVDARMVAWREFASWEGSTPTVIRSTWDYIDDRDGFAAWVRRVAAVAPLWNPPETVLGNLHKRYLIDLAKAGLSVTPTALIEQGGPPKHTDVAAMTDLADWGDIVIKPAVGASSVGTRRFAANDRHAAQEHLDDLLSRGDVLIQPYLESVDGHGERALVWIDGMFTHAVRKTPRFSGGDELVSDAVPIEPDERALGEAVLRRLTGDILYARVDMARDPAGRPVLMELELVEPSLFLLQWPPALEHLVAALVRRLRVASSSR